ncbi:cell surface metalloreductase (FreA) [Penicillium sp. IBT 16267x]|nr:cell surface metalloreductase (FreA) [Penicillium sp. IBT 16267x]
MEILTIYAAVAGGILLSIVVVRAVTCLGPWGIAVKIFIAKHITYPYVIGRHALLGPWTRAGVLMHVSYAALNLVLILFKSATLSIAGNRAGTLSLINAVFLVASCYLSNVADLFGIYLRNCRRIHRAAGWMVLSLVSLHVFAKLLIQQPESLDGSSRKLFAIIGAGILAALGFFSLPIFRRISYECFLRTHQAFAVVGFYSIWRHVSGENLFPRLYIYVAIGVLACTLCFNLALFLFRNGLFSGNGCPRARITCQIDGIDNGKSENATKLTPIKICIYLPRPITVMAGQYINLWLPSVSIWSWAQTHPFMVTSWFRGKHGMLEILVQPHQGLTKTLARRANLMGPDGFSCMALFSGPHGITESVENYESVLLVASGMGLAAVIPYVKMLIHGYNTCTSYVRRVHLIWQVEALCWFRSTSHTEPRLTKQALLFRWKGC